MINNDVQNTTQKTKDRAVPTQLKTGGEPMCSGRIACVTLVANSVISHEWGKDWIVITTNGVIYGTNMT
jgi:hypothetical protein